MREGFIEILEATANTCQTSLTLQVRQPHLDGQAALPSGTKKIDFIYTLLFIFAAPVQLRITVDPKRTRSGRQVLRAAAGQQSQSGQHIGSTSNDLFFQQHQISVGHRERSHSVNHIQMEATLPSSGGVCTTANKGGRQTSDPQRTCQKVDQQILKPKTEESSFKILHLQDISHVISVESCAVKKVKDVQANEIDDKMGGLSNGSNLAQLEFGQVPFLKQEIEQMEPEIRVLQDREVQKTSLLETTKLKYELLDNINRIGKEKKFARKNAKDVMDFRLAETRLAAPFADKTSAGNKFSFLNIHILEHGRKVSWLHIFLESSLDGVIYLSDSCRTDIIHSSLLPEDKAKNIQHFQNDAPHKTMVEDGNNDALTLATADVGISMGISVGSAIATETGLHVN
ncbi:putative inactive cadmium/zinc-transporting ATPase HMA3 [Tanacetum coccineum]